MMLKVSLRHLLPLATLLCLAPLAQAQYKVVGPDGKVTYTDQPPADPKAKVQAIATPGAGAVPTASLPVGLRGPASRYPVVLYAARGCQPCDAGRGLLVQRGIPFSEKRVETPADIEALQRMSGSRALPLLTIGTQQVRSLSTAEWNGYLDAAGYPQESQLPANYQRPASTPLTTPPAAAAPAPVSSPDAAPPPAPAPATGPNIRF